MFTVLMSCRAPGPSVQDSAIANADPATQADTNDVDAGAQAKDASTDAVNRESPPPPFEAALACDPHAGATTNVASVHAILSFDRARTESGELPSTGTGRIELRTALGVAPTVLTGRRLDVLLAPDGTTAVVHDLGGSSLWMELALKGGPSIIHGADGTAYSTKCGPVAVPVGADLGPDSTLHVLHRNDGSTDIAIDVTNWGTLPVLATSTRVHVGEVTATASLHAYAPAAESVLPPRERGYLLVRGISLPECTSRSVTIDIDHAAQHGQPDPFGNDARTMTTPCPLGWTTAITKERLGVEPPVWLAGKSFADIVSSRVSGRPDNLLCSNCHYDGSGHSYTSAASAGAARAIGPNDVVAGASWAGAGGWGARFASNAIKPQALRDAFSKWLADGAR